MLKLTDKKFLIEPIIDQINGMWFEKRLALNYPSGSYFSDPWKTLDEFQDTPLGNVLSSLGPVGESRLMKLSSSESYTAHSDPDDRYHLAITTNPFSYLIDIDQNILYHIPADGRMWLMDTSHIHVAANFGGRERIHLNIRLLLPKFEQTRPFIKIKIDGGEFDWKQESYIEITPIINRLIKHGKITGFDRINERELLLNLDDKSIIDPITEKLRDKGFSITIS